MYLNVLLLFKNVETFKVRKKKKKKKDKKKKHYWLHHIRNVPVKRLYIHFPTSLLKPVFLIIIVNKTTPLDQDVDSVCKMFPIRLSE